MINKRGCCFFIFQFIYSLLLFSCSGYNKLEQNILKLSNEKEIINLAEVTAFEWTKLYVFTPKIKKYEIQQIIGTEIEKDVDVDRVIVFMNKNEIVLFKREFWNPDEYFKFNFDFDGNEYLEIDKKNSRFKVNRYQGQIYLKLVDGTN